MVGSAHFECAHENALNLPVWEWASQKMPLQDSMATKQRTHDRTPPQFQPSVLAARLGMGMLACVYSRT